jgi:hypothetical protein
VISTPGIMAVLSGLLFSFGFLLIASGVRNSVAALRFAGAALVSIPVGGITYAILGAKVGQHMGLRFYSFPFGAAELHSRTQVWGSVACWVVLWLVALSLLFSRFEYGKDRQHRSANGR